MQSSLKEEEIQNPNTLITVVKPKQQSKNSQQIKVQEQMASQANSAKQSKKN